MTKQEAIDFGTDRLELFGGQMEEFIKLAVEALKEQRPKGHWIEVAQYSDGKHKIECSECGNFIFDRGHANSHNVKEKYKFCNSCGADMREVES